MSTAKHWEILLIVLVNVVRRALVQLAFHVVRASDCVYLSTVLVKYVQVSLAHQDLFVILPAANVWMRAVFAIRVLDQIPAPTGLIAPSWMVAMCVCRHVQKTDVLLELPVSRVTVCPTMWDVIRAKDAALVRLQFVLKRMDSAVNVDPPRRVPKGKFATPTRGCAKCQACATNVLTMTVAALALGDPSACRDSALLACSSRTVPRGLTATPRHLRVSVHLVRV